MAEHDDRLPDFGLSDSSEKLPSIEEIIAEEQKARADEDKFLKKENNKKNSKRVLVGVSGLAVTGLVIGSIWMFNPFNDKQNIKHNDPDRTEVTASPNENYNKQDPNHVETAFGQDAIPFKTKEWQVENFVDQEETDEATLRENILKFEAGSSLEGASGTLPSEETGFTSDLGQAELEDGTFNPLFSYWTKESFTYEVGAMTERLLNPLFGGWDSFQLADSNANANFDPNVFIDLFTTDFLDRNLDKPRSEWVPVFADWNSNDYGLGDKLPKTASRWFGQVVSSQADFVYNDDLNQYDVEFIAQVKWSAWDTKQVKLEKTGTLTLNLVSNAQDLNQDSNKRVLINGGSLKVDG